VRSPADSPGELGHTVTLRRVLIEIGLPLVVTATVILVGLHQKVRYDRLVVDASKTRATLDHICSDTATKLEIANGWLVDADRVNTAKGAIMVLGYIDHVCKAP